VVPAFVSTGHTPDVLRGGVHRGGGRRVQRLVGMLVGRALCLVAVGIIAGLIAAATFTV